MQTVVHAVGHAGEDHPICIKSMATAAIVDPPETVRRLFDTIDEGLRVVWRTDGGRG